jgi:hypothetical protein
MTFKDKIAVFTRRLMMEEIGELNGCPPETTRHSRPYQSPLVQYATITPNQFGNAQADYLLPLPAPRKIIILVSCAPNVINNSLYMHFGPLNKTYSGVSITPTGTENWIPVVPAAFSANFTPIGWGYKFTGPLPVQGLYFDIGFESGNRSPYTFLLTDDIDYWKYIVV